jgi:hypothetical protein
MATAPNLGTGGSVLDAQFGSSSTSNTNEPLALAHSGTNYLYVPGVSGNYASVPDSAALDITGDIDIKARVALDDWTPSALIAVAGKWNNTGNQKSWVLTVQTDGTLILFFTTDGATALPFTSTAATGLTDGSIKWVRATVDVDNGAGSRVCKFYLSDDGTTWTQLGTTVTTAGTITFFSGTANVEIGTTTSGTANLAALKAYRVIIQNAYDTANNTSNVVLDADFTTGITSGGQTSFTESSSNAATVTINRSTSGRKSVAVVRPVWLLGTDDFFEVADNDLLDFGATDSFTVVAIYRNWSTTATQHTYVSKKQDTLASTVGWMLYGNPGLPNATAMISDGTNRPYVDGVTAGAAGTAVMSVAIRNTETDQVIAYTRVGSAATTGTDTTTTSIANNLAMRIGRRAGSGTNYADVELLAAMVFRRALSAAELSAIAAYYGV